MQIGPGVRLGPYEILAPLGKGGMGEVWRAHDPRLGRDVALKVLPDAVAGDPERLARFEREARTVAGLSHPNIVTLFSVEEALGTRFLTMELVEGETLDRSIVPGGLPAESVLATLVPLAEALVAAHARGIVHRDLKPANVMRTRDGRVKVLDFGLARSVDHGSPGATDATRSPNLSVAGAVIGTLPYMAPEQVRGGVTDARTDIFAFGALGYELFSGGRPFQAASPAELASAILRDTPAALPAGAGPLGAILLRCLAKSPQERFPAASDLLAALRALAKQPPAPGRTGGPSIAVLPFANMSADPENEFFADGLTEELLNVLARVPELKVTGRTSSFAFKGRNEDLREIGQKLGVATLLEGSVRKSGNRVRITAQLIKAEDGFHLWSDTFDRVIDDIFAVQDDIAKAVSTALHVTLLGRKRATAPGNPEAYARILEANARLQIVTEESVVQAIVLFREAIELDPQDARAWSGLARAHLMRALYIGSVAHEHREARRAVEKALALDDHLAEPHETLSIILASFEFRLTEAGVEIERALALAPGSGRILASAAIFRSCLGEGATALAMARRGVELDPMSPEAWMNLNRVEGWFGDLERARTACLRADQLSPGFISARAMAGLLAIRLGRGEEALAEIRREASPGYRDCCLAIGAAMLGLKEESDAALERLYVLEDYWSIQIALVHAERGEADEAFRALERAFDVRDSGILTVGRQYHLRSLHTDPRWPAFMAKVGLPLT